MLAARDEPLVERLKTAVDAMPEVRLVDLVILNDAPALLRHRVVRDGVLLLQRSPVDRVHFVTRMLRDYQDGQIRREWATRRRIQRLTAGVTDGGSRDLLEKARGVARLLGKAPSIS